MRIFRYLSREISSSFMAVALIVLLIFLSSRFIKYLVRAANGEFSSDILLWIMFYRLPGFIEVILPLALFVGVMLACGRLYVDSEMIVLQSCGISKSRLLLYAQGPALFLLIILLFFTCYLTPQGWQKYYQLWNNPENFNGISTLVEGSFKSVGNGNVVIYTGHLNQDKTQLKDVFLLRHLGEEEGNRISVIRSYEAQVITLSQQERYVELQNGMEYTGLPGQAQYAVSEFSRYGQLVQVAQTREVTKYSTLDAYDSSILFNSEGLLEKVAFQWRIAMPFMVPITVIFALFFSETNHRKGRYAKILPALVLYMLYFGLLLSVRSSIEKGRMPLLSLWYVHSVFLLLGLAFMYGAGLRRSLFKRSKAA